MNKKDLYEVCTAYFKQKALKHSEFNQPKAHIIERKGDGQD